MGPFCIKKISSNTYSIELPRDMSIIKIFNIKYNKKNWIIYWLTHIEGKGPP